MSEPRHKEPQTAKEKNQKFYERIKKSQIQAQKQSIRQSIAIRNQQEKRGKNKILNVCNRNVSYINQNLQHTRLPNQIQPNWGGYSDQGIENHIKNFYPGPNWLDQLGKLQKHNCEDHAMESETLQNQLRQYDVQKLKNNQHSVIEVRKEENARELQIRKEINIRQEQNKQIVKNDNYLEFRRKKILFKVENYIIFDEVLGEGTYAKVYLAINASTMEKMAVKQLSELQENQIKTLKNVKSPYIIQLFKIWKHKSKTYLFIELCQRNLREELARKIDLKQRLKYFDDIVKGMDVLFSHNIIHRDLKFENILIGIDGYAKITDFGLSKHLGYQSNVESVRCGTPYTMAPQIFTANYYTKPTYNQKCDIWSLGVILHQILYDRHPYDLKVEKMLVNNRVSVQQQFGSLDKLIDRCLIHSPQNRLDWDQFKIIYAQRNVEIGRKINLEETNFKKVKIEQKKKPIQNIEERNFQRNIKPIDKKRETPIKIKYSPKFNQMEEKMKQQKFEDERIKKSKEEKERKQKAKQEENRRKKQEIKKQQEIERNEFFGKNKMSKLKQYRNRQVNNNNQINRHRQEFKNRQNIKPNLNSNMEILQHNTNIGNKIIPIIKEVCILALSLTVIYWAF